MTIPAHQFQLRLLFDQDLRDDFLRDRDTTLDDAGLTEEDRILFERLDATGLELDASMRRDYLMSALCRPFALSACVLGSAPGGARTLSAFLASPRVFDEIPARSEAFGVHLGRVLNLSLDASPPVKEFLRSFLAIEQSLVERAARLREAIARGETIAPLVKPDEEGILEGRVRLAPFASIAELPNTPAALRTALDGAGPEDAWHRIISGRLSFARVLSVARADVSPITFVSRAVPRGFSFDRAGASGIAQIVDVTHLTVELAGRRREWLESFDGTRRLDELAPEEQGLTRKLLDTGVLDLAE